MGRHGLIRLVAVISVLGIVGAACASDEGTSGGTTGGEIDCATVEFGCVEVGADEPITIGSLLVETTADKALGIDSEYGIELAIDHLDGSFDGAPAQLLGHDVNWIKEDDTCSADGGQSGSTKLAADPTMFVVIGTSCSSAALGVADKNLGNKGIVLISPSNTNPALTLEGTHNDFYMRTAHNDVIQAGVVSDFVTSELKPQSAVAIHDESPYTTALAELFTDNMKNAGVDAATPEAIDSEQQDFKSMLTKLGQSSPNVIYMPVFNPACGLIPKQAADVPGLADTTFIGSDGCANQTTADLGGDAVNGMYRSGPDLTKLADQDFYQNEFLPAYYDLSGETNVLSAFHAHAYDAMNMIAAALDKVAIKHDDGSLSIPRQAFRDAMFATSNFPGIVFNYDCNSTGDCATDVSIAVYQIPNDPNFGDANAQPVFSETKTLADYGIT
jgi:branched-chain amino acid transport system substrate-binding protein